MRAQNRSLCSILLFAVVTNDKTHLLGANTLGHGVHAWEAFGIEIITTFALVFVIFCTAVDPYVTPGTRL